MTMVFWWFIALGAGLCATLQSAVNGNITKNLNSYTAMACNFVFFTFGTLFFVLYGLWQRQFSFSGFTNLRWQDYAGGVFGFGVVLFLTLAFPRLGAATTMALMVLGQFFVALLVDSQGFFGMPEVPITPARVIAVLLIISGVVLINR